MARGRVATTTSCPSMPSVGAAVLHVARAMARRGLVVGTSGNVSARVGDGFVITPSRSDYERLAEDDLVAVGADGRHAPGGREPSIETPLHRAAYAARPDVGAVVHTHSPYATAWSMAGRPLVDTEDLAYYGVGTVATVPRAPAGSRELAESCAALLGGGNALLLEGHGVLVVGASPAAALTLAEVVERQAQISWLTACLRRAESLSDIPPAEFDALDARPVDPSRGTRTP